MIYNGPYHEGKKVSVLRKLFPEVTIILPSNMGIKIHASLLFPSELKKLFSCVKEFNESPSYFWSGNTILSIFIHQKFIYVCVYENFLRSYYSPDP